MSRGSPFAVAYLIELIEDRRRSDAWRAV